MLCTPRGCWNHITFLRKLYRETTAPKCRAIMHDQRLKYSHIMRSFNKTVSISQSTWTPFSFKSFSKSLHWKIWYKWRARYISWLNYARYFSVQIHKNSNFWDICQLHTWPQMKRSNERNQHCYPKNLNDVRRNLENRFHANIRE